MSSRFFFYRKPFRREEFKHEIEPLLETDTAFARCRKNHNTLNNLCYNISRRKFSRKARKTCEKILQRSNERYNDKLELLCSNSEWRK